LQNALSAEGAALEALALVEVGDGEALEVAAELSLPPPPQAVSSTNAAAPASPVRHRVRVRRMRAG
jgi:hypothetical protein